MTLASTLYGEFRREQLDPTSIPAYGNLDAEQRRVWDRVAEKAEDACQSVIAGYRCVCGIDHAFETTATAVDRLTRERDEARDDVMRLQAEGNKLLDERDAAHQALAREVIKGDDLQADLDDAIASRDEARKSIDIIRDWLDANGHRTDGTIAARARDALANLTAEVAALRPDAERARARTASLAAMPCWFEGAMLEAQVGDAKNACEKAPVDIEAVRAAFGSGSVDAMHAASESLIRELALFRNLTSKILALAHYNETPRSPRPGDKLQRDGGIATVATIAITWCEP
jgi:hypothetical protein